MKTLFTVLGLGALISIACNRTSSPNNAAEAIAAVEFLLKASATSEEVAKLRPFQAHEYGGSEDAGAWDVRSANGKRRFYVSRDGKAGEVTLMDGNSFTFPLQSKRPNQAPEPTTTAVTPRAP